MMLIGTSSAYGDDMDFGSLEAEQVKKGAPSLEEDPKPTTTLGGAADATGTSTVRSGGKWSEIKRNIGVGFFSYLTMEASEVNRSKGQLDAYNYPTFEYRTGRGEKLFFRPAFMLYTAGEDLRGTKTDSRFQWSDAFFGYASNSIPWLPFEMDYKSEIRVYVPTSDSSRDEGMIARIRGDLKAHYPLTNRLTFLLWFKPDYFIQTRTAKYLPPRTPNERPLVRGTRDYGYELSANLYYQMRGGVFGLGGSVQHEQNWVHASVAENIPVFYYEDVSAQVFLGVNAFGFLSHIGVEQKRDVARPRNQFVAFNDNEMQYFARTYYRF